MQAFFGMRKKTKKVEKRASVPPWTDRVGGLAEAAGKVRKGKPSGPGQHTHPFRTTPAPARGTANLNRCARSPYPRGTPASGLLRLGADPGNIPAEPDNLRKDPDGICKKVLQKPTEICSGRVPGASGSAPGPFRNTPERKKCKKLIVGRHNRRPNFFRGRF